MGKKAIGRLLGKGHKVRKGRILKPVAQVPAEAVTPIVEEVSEVVVEEVEDVPKAPKPKAKRSYSRKKKSSKSAK